MRGIESDLFVTGNNRKGHAIEGLANADGAGVNATELAAFYAEGAGLSGGATVTSTYGLYIEGNGVGVNRHGILIEDQAGGTTNFAIKTGAGLLQWGDVEQSASVAFASLPASPANGMHIYCSNCTVTSGVDNTCVGIGSGAFALRVNGAWKCIL